MNHRVYALYAFPRTGIPKHMRLCVKGRRPVSSVASLLPMGFTCTVLPHPIPKAAPKNLLVPGAAFPLKPYSVRPHFQSRLLSSPCFRHLCSWTCWISHPLTTHVLPPCLRGSFWQEVLLYPPSSTQSGTCLSCQQPPVFSPPVPRRTPTML